MDRFFVDVRVPGASQRHRYNTQRREVQRELDLLVRRSPCQGQEDEKLEHTSPVLIFMSFKADHLLKAAAALRGGGLKIHARPQTATSLSGVLLPHIEKRPKKRDISHHCRDNVLNRRALFGDRIETQFFVRERPRRLRNGNSKVPVLLWR